MNKKYQKKVFTFLLTGFFLVQPALASSVDAATCWDECSYSGQAQEAGGYYRTCGNYDSDYCYEWSSWKQDTSYTSSCSDECSYSGQRQENGDQYRTCGNYDSDSCYDWSPWKTDTTCTDDCSYSGQSQESGDQYRTCNYYDSDPCLDWSPWKDSGCDSCCNDDCDDCDDDDDGCDDGCSGCSDQCSYSGQKACSGTNSYKTCGNYDSDSCLEWSSLSNCGSGMICQNGNCVSYECEPGQTQTESCGYCGEKTRTCQSDYEWGNWSSCTDQGECNSGNTETRGCGDGDDGTQSRTCNSSCYWGNWSTCDGGDETLYLSASASPSSGCAPLDSVDFQASVSGTADGSITYFFDCRNDGVWEKVYTTSNSSYTAYDLCNYSNPGTYYARVRVERDGLVAERTVSVNANSCTSNAYLSVEKEIKNLTKGTSWQQNVSASPSDMLSFRIRISSSGSQSLSGVRLEDILPSKLNYEDNLTIDGYTSTGSISNLYLGSISSYQTKEIVFDARVASSGSFGSGTTNIVNYARVTASNADERSDSAMVTVTRGSFSETDIEVQKTGRNLTDGEQTWKDSVIAEPGDVIEFRIVVSNDGDTIAEDVFLSDILPANISYLGSLTLSGSSISGNIVSGIQIGDISSGKKKTVIFRAIVASKEYFNFGSNIRTNFATASGANFGSISDTATVDVRKQEIKGATDVVTGVMDPLQFAAVISLMLSLLFLAVQKVFLKKSPVLAKVSEKCRQLRSYLFSN